MRNEITIQKIISYAEKIISYCQNINEQSTLTANPILVESCVFNLCQIGELVHRLDDEFMENHPDIPWRALYGLRNRIVHDYEGVNLNLIWDIIKLDLPELVEKLRGFCD